MLYPTHTHTRTWGNAITYIRTWTLSGWSSSSSVFSSPFQVFASIQSPISSNQIPDLWFHLRVRQKAEIVDPKATEASVYIPAHWLTDLIVCGVGIWCAFIIYNKLMFLKLHCFSYFMTESKDPPSSPLILGWEQNVQLVLITKKKKAVHEQPQHNELRDMVLVAPIVWLVSYPMNTLVL